ncbi:MAG: hypothetical protein ACRD4J_07790 [Nitrososphaeraceae archaeon]
MGFIAALISTDKSLSKAQGLLLKAGVKMVYSLPFYAKLRMSIAADSANH